MHAIVFAAKRVHLRTVSHVHAVVKPVKGMTAARFDLLVAVARVAWVDPVYGVRPAIERWRRLSAVTRELGLHRTTVSKMVGRLVEMGWLRAERYAWDRRHVGVAFTSVGLAKLREATAMGTAKVERAVARCFEEEARDGRNAAQVIAAVVAVWWRVGRYFADHAVALYPAPA